MFPPMSVRRWILLSLVFALPIAGAELKEAKVTAVVNDVNLLPAAAAARKATVNDEVRRGTAVRTGMDRAAN